jgi:metal-dependent amidase/aminoacylase/carboxypeptidase family protein
MPGGPRFNEFINEQEDEQDEFEPIIIDGVNIHALVAACDSYDDGPGTVGIRADFDAFLRRLGVKKSWADISKEAYANSYSDK